MIEPIGIFDSGVGGLSIWKEIHQLMPNESTIYLADSYNAPYGQKTKEEIVALCLKNTELLLAKKCKIIVVACNTATTNAIQYLRETYDVPFIGIEPAIKPAAIHTKTKKIGILATKGTLTSELFNSTSDLYASKIEIIEQVGAGIVELIETGQLNSQEMKDLLVGYVQPMVEKDIDHLVLGCTHYPFLIPLLQQILPKTVSIIDSGAAVAKQTQYILQKRNLANDSFCAEQLFYTNSKYVSVAKELIGKQYSITYQNF